MRIVFLFIAATSMGGLLGYLTAPQNTNTQVPSTLSLSQPKPVLQDTQASDAKASDAKTEEETALLPDDNFETWLGSRPTQMETGEGQISGKIRLNNEPMPEVTVTARPVLDSQDLDSLSLAEQLLAIVEREEWREARSRTTTTDEEGRFSFNNLMDDSQYYVRPRQNGYYFSETNPRSNRQVSIGSDVEYMARKAMTTADLDLVPVRFNIVLDTEPVENCKLRVRQPSTNVTRSYAWTRADPVVRIPAGPLIITAEHLNLRSEPMDVNADEESPTVRIELLPRTHLVGIVTGVNEQLHASLRVHKTGVDLDENNDLRLRSYSSGSPFDIDLEPGSYTAVLRTQNSGILAEWPIEISPGFNSAHFHFESEKAGLAELEVSVQGPNGEIDPNIHFRLNTVVGDSRKGTSATTLRQSGTTSWLNIGPAAAEVLSGKTEGSLTLSIHSPKFGNTQIEVSSWEPLNIEFDPTATCTISLVGYYGSGLEGKLSFALRSLDSKNDAYSEKLDWLGNARLSNIRPGSYLLTTKVEDGFRGREIASQECQLSAGDNEVQVSVPQIYSLRVNFDSSFLGRRVQLRGKDSNSFPTQKTITSQVVFEKLNRGEYTLTVGIGSMTVQIPADKEVIFSAPAIDTMVIEKVSPNSNAYEAGLRGGDWIIAIDNTPFSSDQQVVKAFGKIRNGGTLTFTIQRESGELQLTLKMEDMQGISQPKFIQR